jgi:hypothetical protein
MDDWSTARKEQRGQSVERIVRRNIDRQSRAVDSRMEYRQAEYRRQLVVVSPDGAMHMRWSVGVTPERAERIVVCSYAGEIKADSKLKYRAAYSRLEYIWRPYVGGACPTGRLPNEDGTNEKQSTRGIGHCVAKGANVLRLGVCVAGMVPTRLCPESDLATVVMISS